MRVDADDGAINEPKVTVSVSGSTTAPQLLVLEATPTAIAELNDFAARVFITRGGRMGSGLGLLLESLWGFYTSAELRPKGLEIAWLADNQYNDYACVEVEVPWDPSTRAGELLRIEAKSMNLGADESKGHFDEPAPKIGELDLLVVLLWKWELIDGADCCPRVIDAFVGSARHVALLRDALHRERGGTFVEAGACPDDPGTATCAHVGEPINASGMRERRTGPEALRGSKVSYAANFGGLVRMLKCASPSAIATMRRVRREDDVAHEYISFIHRHLPHEEANSFRIDEWRTVYRDLQVEGAPPSSKLDFRNAVAKIPGYQYRLRQLD